MTRRPNDPSLPRGGSSPPRKSAVAGPGDDTLGVESYAQLRNLLINYCGLELAMDHRAAAERKLRERVSATGSSGFADYVRSLEMGLSGSGDGELDEAVETLTTHETYFFREAYQLRALVDEVIPVLADHARQRKRLTIWSAGCSTGEEVYSIGATLLDSPALAGLELRVLGTDISTRCIAHAKRGVYGPSALRSTSPEQLKQWFVEAGDDPDRADGSKGEYVSRTQAELTSILPIRARQYEVVGRLRSICHFSAFNLLDADRHATLGRVDAIFCRNVLIYLGQQPRRQLIELFHERLYPGGVLFLGHSESLLHVSTAFELLHLRDDLAYRRPPRALRDSGTRDNMSVQAGTSPQDNLAKPPKSDEKAGFPSGSMRISTSRITHSHVPPAVDPRVPLPRAPTDPQASAPSTDSRLRESTSRGGTLETPREPMRQVTIPRKPGGGS